MAYGGSTCRLYVDAGRPQAARENLLDALVARSIEQCELPDGLQLRFTAGSQILAEIARTVEAERRCCRFLSFEITVPQDEGPMILAFQRDFSVANQMLPVCSRFVKTSDSGPTELTDTWTSDGYENWALDQSIVKRK
jgi:hypothetical protein